ncbi:sensor histidine kinase N-terminal domain-containing protein [Devosia sp.]|uniref:sensor histidine kinase n=1 Tax=Devosia sp. TaxID=1871048 RepID=UPI00326321A1
MGLTIRVTLPLLAILAIGIWISVNGSWQQAQQVTDRLLVASARVIAEDLTYSDGQISAPIPPAALEMFASESRDRVVYRVVAADGRLIAGYMDLDGPPAILTTSDGPKAYDITFRAAPMRAVSFPQIVITPTGVVPVTVLVAQTVNARLTLFQSLLVGQVIQQGVLVTVAALFIWFGINRELRPLLALAATVRQRGPDQLSPLPHDKVQTELQPMVLALNDFMARLKLQLTRQRDFLDTAAHQLRTPLSVLKTQVGYALRTPHAGEKDEALKAIDEDLSAMARLTNQLLVLARSEHDQPTLSTDPVDLAVITREVAAAAAPRALDAGIEVTVDAPVSALILGNAVLLRELVGNLVENFVLYAGEGVIANLTVSSRADQVGLRVADNGVGIAAADRDRILQRFERGANSPGFGSGLGLSIVVEIVSLFHGSITFTHPETGSGFVVDVQFPALATDQIPLLG